MHEDKDARPWVKLSLDYFRNFKVMRLSNDAKVLHLSLIVASAEQKSDGLLPAAACKMLGDGPFQELVDHGFLDAEGEDYRIHDYQRHQTPAEIIQSKSNRGSHARWHVKAGKYDASCAHCQEDAANGEAWMHTPPHQSETPPW